MLAPEDQAVTTTSADRRGWRLAALALRTSRRFFATGGASAPARTGHRPLKVVIGGFVVWGAFVGLMLGDGKTLPPLAHAATDMVERAVCVTSGLGKADQRRDCTVEDAR